MAYDILNGKDVSEAPAEAMSDFQYVCRPQPMHLSITLPEDGSVTVDRRLRRRKKKGER